MNKESATFSLQIEEASKILRNLKQRIELLRGYL